MPMLGIEEMEPKILPFLSRGSIILSLHLICSSKSHINTLLLGRHQWHALCVVSPSHFQRAWEATTSITLSFIISLPFFCEKSSSFILTSGLSLTSPTCQWEEKVGDWDNLKYSQLLHKCKSGIKGSRDRSNLQYFRFPVVMAKQIYSCSKTQCHMHSIVQCSHPVK